MKKQNSSSKSGAEKASLPKPDFTSPEKNTDKTKGDNDADKTIKRNKAKKSKLEVDPDSTKIDTDADKTDKLNPTDQQITNRSDVITNNKLV